MLRALVEKVTKVVLVGMAMSAVVIKTQVVSECGGSLLKSQYSRG